MSAFTPAGSGGVPLTATSDGATNPTVTVVNMPTASTEYSCAVPIGARQFIVKLRGLSPLQVAYVAGQSGVTYITVPRGCFLAESDLKLTSTVTIYFQSPDSAQVAEILYWT